MKVLFFIQKLPLLLKDAVYEAVYRTPDFVNVCSVNLDCKGVGDRSTVLFIEVV